MPYMTDEGRVGISELRMYVRVLRKKIGIWAKLVLVFNSPRGRHGPFRAPEEPAASVRREMKRRKSVVKTGYRFWKREQGAGLLDLCRVKVVRQSGNGVEIAQLGRAFA